MTFSYKQQNEACVLQTNGISFCVLTLNFTAQCYNNNRQSSLGVETNIKIVSKHKAIGLFAWVDEKNNQDFLSEMKK